MEIGDIVGVLIILSLGPGLLVLAFLIHRRAEKLKKLYKDHPEVAKKYLEKREKKELIHQKIGLGIRFIIGFAFILSGLGVLGEQIYIYLRYGFWKPSSVLTAIDNESGSLLENLKSPPDWIGLSKIYFYIFDNLPLSFTLIFIGILFLTSGSE